MRSFGSFKLKSCQFSQSSGGDRLGKIVAGSLGDKWFRWCPIQGKKVKCDGLCKVVFGLPDNMRESGFEDCHMCSVEKYVFCPGKAV
jgi:hypothetical protein